MKRKLPDEILFKVFQDFSFTDLLKCQQVCRSWYSPAHIKLLKVVKLTSDRVIKQFIASFDENPNESSFKAVRTLQISVGNVEVVPERESLEKLLLRFPNLEHVDIDGFRFIKNFDEELCKAILLHCPNLDTFDVGANDQDPDAANYLVKVRPLLTRLYLPLEKNQPNLGDPVQYLTQFPRLQTLHFEDDAADSFGTFLPVIEQLSNITDLTLGLKTDNVETSGRRYLTTRSKEVQDQIKKRLANITDLFIYPYSEINNALTFVSEYFTGLDYFRMERDFSRWGPSADQDAFFTNLFSLITSPKVTFYVDFEYVDYTTVASNFPALVQNMFQNALPVHKQSNSRVLKLNVGEDKGGPNMLGLVLRATKATRQVCIDVQERFHLGHIFMELFTGDAPMDQVDEFVLQFMAKDSRRMVIDTPMYLKLLEPMSSLKKVKLEVPYSYMQLVHSGNQPYEGPTLPHVEDLTLTAKNANGNMQSLLNSCSSAFPNLKRLDISCFSGVWKSYIGEFQLYLQDYSLENLVIDTSPLVFQMNQFNFYFFVVELEIQSSGERHLYEVSLDHSFCRKTNFGDLRGLVCLKDYLRLRLTINRSRQVELKNVSKVVQSCVIMLDESDNDH